jgi:Domain of unknown function (DUF4417)
MTIPLITCSQCAWREPCGGAHGQLSMHGCFVQCQTPGLCEENTWACPCRGHAFQRMIREVGGLGDREWLPLAPSQESLPLYVPIIRHRAKRRRPFAPEVAGISIRDLLPRRTERHYYPVAESADELRDRFGLARGTRVIVSGVALDDVIERYWAFRNVTHVPQLLARLGISAMTVPNYSYFRNAPRTHTLYNRKRLMIAAEELSAAGVAVIPHLNAITDEDWRVWARLLAAQPGIVYVAKEFQTGNRTPARGALSVDKLRGIQDHLGRPLHPVAIGGGQHVRALSKHFHTFTVADSHPFMCAVNRRELVGSDMYPRPVLRPRSVDALLERNVRKWAAALHARAEAFRLAVPAYALRMAI